MYTQGQGITEHTDDTAYNTDQMVGAFAMMPKADWDFVEFLPPDLPLVINYRTGGGGGAIVRQLTLTYVGTDVATMTRTI